MHDKKGFDMYFSQCLVLSWVSQKLQKKNFFLKKIRNTPGHKMLKSG
jgi:hypothetical protein